MLQQALPFAVNRSPIPRSLARQSRSVDLEGFDLLEAAARHLDFVQVGKPATSLRTPAGKSAFGYRPRRWPVDAAFREPATFRQLSHFHREAWGRGLTRADVVRLTEKLAQAYEISGEESRALVSLATDWLRHANSEMLGWALAR
jgi:hypothetical protein